MAEIIYLKDILFIKPDYRNKSEKKSASPVKLKSARCKRPLKASLVEKKTDNKRN